MSNVFRSLGATAFGLVVVLSAGPVRAERIWVPVPLPKSEALSPTPTTADIERGKTLFRQCRACHALGNSAERHIGPPLDGIVGRRAAARPDYAYSDDLTKAGQEGLVWTRDFLSAYLRKPADFLNGTKMAFTGVTEAGDRTDLIAYLSTFDVGAEPESGRIGEEASDTQPTDLDTPRRE